MDKLSSHKLANFSDHLHYSQLNAVRLLAVLAMGLGYASTMPIGPGTPEIAKHWGLDPSWMAIQVLFFISGIMACRSLTQGRAGLAYMTSRFKRIFPWLVIYTLAVITVIYPVLCSPEARSFSEVPKLLRYFVETVTFAKPSQPLPGLMDDAKYMCLAQGAIWTLRWGLSFHIGTAIFGKLKLFENKYIALVLFGLATVVFAAAHGLSVKQDIAWLDKLLPAFRLGYIFIGGMAIYLWQDRLRISGAAQLGSLITLAIITSIQFKVLRWTPMLEISATFFWCFASYTLLQNPVSQLKNWPNIVLPTFLGIWPLAQIYTLAYPTLSLWGVIIATLVSSLALAMIALYVKSLLMGKSLPRKVTV